MMILPDSHANMAKAPPIMEAVLVARPSMPSVRLEALETAVTTKMATNTYTTHTQFCVQSPIQLISQA